MSECLRISIHRSGQAISSPHWKTQELEPLACHIFFFVRKGRTWCQVVRQIQLDVARTFPAIPAPSGNWGWPEDGEAEREGCLARVLMAFECRALDSLGSLGSI